MGTAQIVAAIIAGSVLFVTAIAALLARRCVRREVRRATERSTRRAHGDRLARRMKQAWAPPPPHPDGETKFAYASLRELVLGQPAAAALGICHYLRVSEAHVAAGLAAGVESIVREVTSHGSAADIECLNYVLHESCGCGFMTFQDGLKRDCDAKGELLPSRQADDRNGGQRPMAIDDFVAHPHARQCNLTKAHVVALRLYTTAAFASINAPLRDLERFANKMPHPMPVTVSLIRDALGKLRAVDARTSKSTGDKEQALELYRGMKNVTTPKRFLEIGGTELAPMSTTSSLSVAMSYSASKDSVLLRILTDSFISRGPDISFLSAFPAEQGYLFPPLTFLLPTGNVEKVSLGGQNWTVIDVKPYL